MKKSEIKTALQELINYCPEYWPEIPEGDEEELEQDVQQPLFSEAYLYNTFGKDKARTILALMRNVCEACDLNMHDLYKEE